MRRIIIFTAGVLALLAPTALAPAQWGRGNCGPVGPLRFEPVQVNPTQGYSWKPSAVAGCGHQSLLYFGPAVVGGWDHRGGPEWPDGYYRSWNGLAWGPLRAKAPIDPPPCPPGVTPFGKECRPPCNCKNCKCRACECPDCKCDKCPGKPAAEQLPTGVEADKLTWDSAPKYYRKGERTSKGEAVAALRSKKGSDLTDDRKKLRLTLIGSDADRAAAMKDVPAELKTRINLWSVPPDHWSIAGLGFMTDGKPTVYLQAPDGRVLWRQDAGPVDVGMIRKKVDEYDAKKDPGPHSGGSFNLSEIPGWMWMGGVFGVLILFLLLRQPHRQEAPSV